MIEWVGVIAVYNILSVPYPYHLVLLISWHLNLYQRSFICFVLLLGFIIIQDISYLYIVILKISNISRFRKYQGFVS